MSRLISHFRSNGVAYVALFFAIGGGGAAIAATTAKTTVHACVNKKTGVLYVVRHCPRTTRALSFNERGPTGRTGARGLQGPAGVTGPAGTPATVAWASVSSNGNADAHGLMVTEPSAGQYAVTVTASQCSGQAIEAPVVTPVGDPTAAGPLSGIPVAWVETTPGSESFTVTVGFIQNGSFVPGNEGFDVQDECGS